MTSIFDIALQARRGINQNILDQLKIQQMQQALPFEQQLQQLKLEQAQHQLAQMEALAPLEMRTAKAKLGQSEFGLAEDRATVLSNAASNALQQIDDNPELAQQIITHANDQFNLGVDPSQVTKADLKAFRLSMLPEQSGLNIKSTRIFDDGTVVSQTDKGPVAWDPAGNMLEGDSAQRQINQANQFETNIQRQRALQRKTADQSIIQSTKAFEQLPAIRSNIANLNKGIQLIDEGAKTGRIQRLFPSFQSASIELDNLRGQLGLDVVGLTTFGALSKGELDLALDVALPTALDQTELKEWMQNKRDAQEKLYNVLQDAAIFMGKGGTVAEFLEQGEEAPQQTPYVEGQTAKNPTTGETIIFRNGQWVPQ